MDNYNGSISDLEAFLDNVLNKYGYMLIQHQIILKISLK